MNKQCGLALVIVLWIISLLMIMAGSFALTMRRETTVIHSVKDTAEILASAEAGIAMAERMLALGDEQQRWRADGSIYRFFYRDGEVRVRLFSEQGKIDINKASERTLRSLLQTMPLELEQQQALASAIQDWRDADDLVRINGAETEQYKEAGLSYQPANKNFQILEELKLVLGMTDEIYQLLEPVTTVYSGHAGIDLQVATREVLQAVANLPEEDLDRYIQQRLENLRLHLPPPPFPSDVIGVKQNASDNQVYTIISEARYDDKGNAGIRAVIKSAPGGRRAQPFQVLDWQQADYSDSLFGLEMDALLVNGPTQQDEFFSSQEDDF